LRKKKTQDAKFKNSKISYENAFIKFIKEIRVFYRLYFKHRFHRSDKRYSESTVELVKMLFDEFGITYPPDYDLHPIFDFLYQTHFKARTQDKGENLRLQRTTNCFKIYTTDDVANKEELVTDPVCSQLIETFATNFSDIYMKYLIDNYKTRISDIVHEFKSIA
jgi:hypothetical protein